MALTKFVKNVTDISDNGGYKFRFHCDKCGDGFESQYESASANLLKVALGVFSIFRYNYGLDRAVEGVDRGLRGKERDAAYEKAVHQAMVFFKKCTSCGIWACPEACWNAESGMCENCAPNATEQAAKQVAKQRSDTAVKYVQENKVVGVTSISCTVCGNQTKGEKFCSKCGTNLAEQKACAKCKAPLAVGANFCGGCGSKAI